MLATCRLSALVYAELTSLLEICKVARPKKFQNLFHFHKIPEQKATNEIKIILFIFFNQFHENNFDLKSNKHFSPTSPEVSVVLPTARGRKTTDTPPKQQS